MKVGKKDDMARAQERREYIEAGIILAVTLLTKTGADVTADPQLRLMMHGVLVAGGSPHGFIVRTEGEYLPLRESLVTAGVLAKDGDTYRLRLGAAGGVPESVTKKFHILRRFAGLMSEEEKNAKV